MVTFNPFNRIEYLCCCRTFFRVTDLVVVDQLIGIAAEVRDDRYTAADAVDDLTGQDRSRKVSVSFKRESWILCVRIISRHSCRLFS